MNSTPNNGATSPLPHIRNRRTDHLAPATPALVNECLQCVEDAFNKLWLSKSDGHRIQQLWRRKDGLATSELFCLGLAIRQLKATAPQWLKKTVKRAREANATSHGFITEIIVCGQLQAATGTLTPSANNQAGFDAIATHHDGVKHFISIKRHDISSYEAEFRRLSESIHSALRKRLTELKAACAMHLFCDKPLEQKYANIVINHIRQNAELTGIHNFDEEGMFLAYTPVDRSIGQLASSHISQSLIVVAKEHPNEQKRFRKNIDKARANLKNHAPANGHDARLLYMRVHTSANLTKLHEYATSLFQNGDDIGFDGILLMQPAVARNSEKSTITHHFLFAGNEAFAAQAISGRSYKMAIGIGAISTTSPRNTLTDNSGNVISELNEHYVYQQGEYFILVEPSPGQTEIRANLTSIANGVTVNVVVKIDNQETLLTGIFPPNDDLLVV